MRQLVLAAGLLMILGAPLKADTQDEPILRAPAQWNRWICTARSRFPFRVFRGESYYFRAGSGEGQQAKAVAKLIAERECEFRTRLNCASRESDCRVERH
jgi:hypothetical protein